MVQQVQDQKAQDQKGQALAICYLHMDLHYYYHLILTF
jgi:hypothetical protein